MMYKTDNKAHKKCEVGHTRYHVRNWRLLLMLNLNKYTIKVDKEIYQ